MKLDFTSCCNNGGNLSDLPVREEGGEREIPPTQHCLCLCALPHNWLLGKHLQISRLLEWALSWAGLWSNLHKQLVLTYLINFMVGNGLTWLEIAGNVWKWLEIAEHGWI